MNEPELLSDLDKEFLSESHVRCMDCYMKTEMDTDEFLIGKGYMITTCNFCRTVLRFRLRDIVLSGNIKLFYVSPPVTRSSEPSHDGK